ncbi:MAG: CPBP family intramembrane glutamic endopeptidase [Thermoanaerobaculia bacterium]
MHLAVAIAYALLLCGILPLLAWISKRKLDEGIDLPRMALYAEAFVLQALLLGLSYGTARVLDTPIRGGALLDPPALLVGAATLALALAAMAIGWKIAGAKSADRLRLLVPRRGSERLAWLGVSIAAGVSEEVAFRGVLPIALHRITGTMWVAIAISAAAFAMAHLVQGWWAALFVGLFGLVFHGVVWLTGGLWIAIAVHVLYDIIVGLTMGKLLAEPAEALDAQV